MNRRKTGNEKAEFVRFCIRITANKGKMASFFEPLTGQGESKGGLPGSKRRAGVWLRILGLEISCRRAIRSRPPCLSNGGLLAGQAGGAVAVGGRRIEPPA